MLSPWTSFMDILQSFSETLSRPEADDLSSVSPHPNVISTLEATSVPQFQVTPTTPTTVDAHQSILVENFSCLLFQKS